MSTNQQKSTDNLNERIMLGAEEDHDRELPPPVVTRTRSGRRVRTPAALMDSEVPSLRTPNRRARKSVNPEAQTVKNPEEPVQQLATVECTGGSPPDTVVSNEPEPKLKAKRSKHIEPACMPIVKEEELLVNDKTAEQSVEKSLVSVVSVSVQPNGKENHVSSEKVAVDRVEKKVRKRTRSESRDKRDQVIPLGKPKSGRVWKDRNKQRFSALLRDKPLRSSWEKKMEAKREKALVKNHAMQLKQDKAREKEDKRKRHEENVRRRAENQKKSEIVQVIRNTSKIKRMKKKQLRKIEKRDTLTLLQKNVPRNPKKSGSVPKGKP